MGIMGRANMFTRVIIRVKIEDVERYFEFMENFGFMLGFKRPELSTSEELGGCYGFKRWMTNKEADRFEKEFKELFWNEEEPDQYEKQGTVSFVFIRPRSMLNWRFDEFMAKVLRVLGIDYYELSSEYYLIGEETYFLEYMIMFDFPSDKFPLFIVQLAISELEIREIKISYDDEEESGE